MALIRTVLLIPFSPAERNVLCNRAATQPLMWLLYILVLAELYFASGALALGRRILSAAEPQAFEALLDILGGFFGPTT